MSASLDHCSKGLVDDIVKDSFKRLAANASNLLESCLLILRSFRHVHASGQGCDILLAPHQDQHVIIHLSTDSLFV